jgi:hypothetical protein
MTFEMASDIIREEGFEDWEKSMERSEEKKIKFPINMSTDPELLDVSLLIGTLKIDIQKSVKKETKEIDLSKRSKNKKTKGSGLF